MLPPEIFKAYDIRGIVGRHADAGRSCSRSAARSAALARERERDTIASAATAACPDPS